MKEWIITSSVLILVLILLRFVFRKRISAKLQYALWGLALIRLLLPFSFSSTPISVMNFVQPETFVVEDTTVNTTTQATAGIPAAGTPIVYPAGEREMAVMQPPAPDVPAAPQSRAFALTELLPWIWGIGSILTATLLFGSNLHFYIRLRRDRSSLPFIHTALPVWLSTQISSPCLFGRSIYITPNAMETPERLNHVLTHELCHWQQLDPLWAVLRSLCLAIWWWNPLVWVAAILSRRDCEAACDERAIRELGEPQRLNYGKTLVDMIAVKPAPASLLCTATTMTSRDMRERLQRIAQRKKIWIPAMAIVLVLAMVCVGCTFTGAEAPETVVEPEESSAALVFQSLDGDVLICLDGDKTVRLQAKDLLSEATLRSLREGDVLTVRYTDSSDGIIHALDISVDPVSETVSDVDPAAPSVPAETPDTPAVPPAEEPMEEPEPPSTEPDAPTEDTLVSPDDPAEVTASLEGHFNDPDHGMLRRQVLTHFYDDPTQVDLCALFYNGTETSEHLYFDALSAPEQEAMRKLAYHNEYREGSDIDRLTANEMDIALQQYFGISLSETRMVGLQHFTYLPEFGYYYLFHTDTNALVPIEIVDVLIDSNGLYYMSYRMGEFPNSEPNLCCLRRIDNSWKVLFNKKAGAEADGSHALAAIQNTEAMTYNVLRPGISASLEYAISGTLLDNARAQMPKYADFVTEAHDVLHMEWVDDLLYVDLVSMFKVFNDEDGEVVEIESESGIDCLTLSFWVTRSGEQLCYQLADWSYYEDPSDPDGVFSSTEWSRVAGLNLDDIRTALAAQCDAQASTVPSLDPAYTEAFLAAMSGSESTEAAQNIVDYLGKQRHILHYQLLGAEERQRSTNILIDELKGSEVAAHYGWDDEYIEKNIAVVQVACSVEYNPHFGEELESGVYQQEFYVCRDPETRLWRVYSMGDQIKLVDYNTNN